MKGNVIMFRGKNTQKPGSRGGASYGTYVFRDKDPVIFDMEAVIQDTGMTLTQLSYKSGVSRSALDNLFFGKTRFPRHATVQAVMRACGKQQAWEHISEWEAAEPADKNKSFKYKHLWRKHKKPLHVRKREERKQVRKRKHG